MSGKELFIDIYIYIRTFVYKYDSNFFLCFRYLFRVKEAIKRKDEAIQALQSERDAALDQCSNMEIMVEKQRKELLKLK